MELASAEGKNPVSATPKDVVAKEYFCGIGPFKPKCLQMFRNAKFFTFLVCCGNVLTGGGSALTGSTLSTLTRRYQLADTQIGIIPTMFEIALLVTIIFVSYFGGKGHKPRWLGVSMLMIGLGALVYGLPQFIFGTYFPDIPSPGPTGLSPTPGPLPNTSLTPASPASSLPLESCADSIDFSSADCEATGQNRNALVFFYIGSFLMGTGAASLFTIAPSFIDDTVRPKYVPVYVGVTFMFQIVGVACAFGLSAGFLSVYVDFWRELTVPLQPTSPAWVGAWWLGFLLLAVLAWILAVPFLMFPRLLPGSHLVKAEREKEMAQKYSARDTSADENKNFLTKLASFPRHVLQVVTTPSWVFLTIAVSFLSFLQEFGSFIPKFLEAKFHLPPMLANITVAVQAITVGITGVLTGAFIIRRYTGRTVALIHWILSLCVLLPSLGVMIYCPTVELAGVTVPFADGSILSRPFGQTVSSCNADCNCTSSIYLPVCGSDDVTYFSPCAAGCDRPSVINNPRTAVFENCSCVAASLHLRLSAGDNTAGTLTEKELLLNSTATLGTCEGVCGLLGPSMALTIIFLFFSLAMNIPATVITLRCVADEQRTLALGLQGFFYRLFGNIPGPIVFGVVFDAACLYFRYDEQCMERGNCWLYDNLQLSWSLTIMHAITLSLYSVFALLTWLTYPRVTMSEKGPLAGQTVQAELTADDKAQGEKKDREKKDGGRPKTIEAVNSCSQLLVPSSPLSPVPDP